MLPFVGEAVELISGVIVGDGVGLVVGCFVGDGVGLVVGVLADDRVGLGVGALDEEDEGVTVGTAVGEEVIRTVGTFEGELDGTFEGDADGSDVGDMLGIKLPRIVGAMLGVSVTRTEQNEQQSHVTSGEYPPQSAFTSAFPHCKIVPVSILLSRCKCINLVRSNTGTDPVSALLFSQLYERSRFASSVGIVPPRPDKSYKYSSCSCDNWPNSDGIDPVMPTSDSQMYSKLSSAPNSIGIDPVIWGVLYSQKASNDKSNPNSEGIEPVTSGKLYTNNFFKLESCPICEGKEPCKKRDPAISSSTRFVSAPSSLGMVPPNRVCFRSRYSRHFNPPSSVGIAPLNCVSSSSKTNRLADNWPS